ncbi:hypothetical protein CRG98_026392 [Punica granatum]|uniref:Uncharacterized protein n=1 Tax=Punica granatum TaxID=22663 RepID=A0A2I0JA88_PUNGR|nr:hypothetical protein CRG98_026392 [Punica granatum]
MEEEDNERGGNGMDEAAMSVAVGPTGHKGSSGQSSGLDSSRVRDWVDPRLFSENDHHSHLWSSIRVDPITLGANNHHGHLEGSLGYPEPLTLPQNSIESLRGDVRLDLC